MHSSNILEAHQNFTFNKALLAAHNNSANANKKGGKSNDSTRGKGRTQPF